MISWILFMQVSADSHYFRFRSFHLLQIQNFSKSCRYKHDQSIWQIFNKNFGGFLQFAPTVSRHWSKLLNTAHYRWKHPSVWSGFLKTTEGHPAYPRHPSFCRFLRHICNSVKLLFCAGKKILTSWFNPLEVFSTWIVSVLFWPEIQWSVFNKKVSLHKHKVFLFERYI